MPVTFDDVFRAAVLIVQAVLIVLVWMTKKSADGHFDDLISLIGRLSGAPERRTTKPRRRKGEHG